MRFILIAILALSLNGCGLFKGLFQPPAPAPVPEPDVDVIGLVLSNTAALVVEMPPGSGELEVFCTAVAVEGTFVTADHCIEPLSAAANNTPLRWFVRFRGNDYRAVIVTRWKERDLAIIDAIGARANKTLEVSDWNAELGARVAWSGFPLGDTSVHLFSGAVSNPVDSLDESFYNVDGQFIPGNSGGPVVDEKGRLIGIVSATASVLGLSPHPIDIGRAVRPEYIRELLAF